MNNKLTDLKIAKEIAELYRDQDYLNELRSEECYQSGASSAYRIKKLSYLIDMIEQEIDILMDQVEIEND